MTVRKWFAATALSAGLVATGGAASTCAAEPARPAFSFSALRPVSEADAKAKVEAWLKAAGKYDAAKFDAVWAAPDRSVHDRTLAAIALGLPSAASLVADAKSPSSVPPSEVPALLKDPTLDPFVRSNVAVAYAKALAGRRVYEEAVDAVAGVSPEQVVDPAGFFFYKAVAEHALTRRDAAVASISRLLDDVADAPDRYKVVATLMFFDLQNWSKDEKDLTNIGRLMDNSERRLDLARGGAKTQEIQKKILFRLDETIKEKENKAKSQSQQASSGQCPNGGQQQQPGNKDANQNPNAPMQDSRIATNSGPGQVDVKKLRAYEENWGKLPDAERKAVVQQVIQQYPPKYQAMIEDYFRSLNRMHGYKP